MKNNEATIFVFAASIIIGILVSLNINFGKKTERIFLDAKQYQDAYNLKVKYQSEIGALRDQYNHYNDKLNKYIYLSKNGEEVLQEVKDEINRNISETGYKDVHGPGIKIYIEDESNNDDESMSAGDEYMYRIIHNTDIMYIINDLRAAGAEAIEVNGQRVTDRSEVYCLGSFLGINGIKIATPFTITAIGNKDALKTYMEDPNNFLKSLGLPHRQIFFTVEAQDDITIKANEGQPKANYISNVKK